MTRALLGCSGHHFVPFVLVGAFLLHHNSRHPRSVAEKTYRKIHNLCRASRPTVTSVLIYTMLCRTDANEASGKYLVATGTSTIRCFDWIAWAIT